MCSSDLVGVGPGLLSLGCGHSSDSVQGSHGEQLEKAREVGC